MVSVRNEEDVDLKEGSVKLCKNVIIGTAGHIDHGKTTLISALTGSDTDRLQEEKERGISIDLGFTSLELADNIKAGIIDVPGHEKFVKNMLAGAGGVDLALMVIAADEGVMPQTREHLEIMQLLQVKQGVIAVTKSDMVEDEWIELVVSDIRDQLSDTFLAEAPIVCVSGKENTGLEELKKNLLKAARKVPEKDSKGSLYLPVDRVFTLTGHGTVITGTLISGQIEIEDEVLIYPSKIEARIRSLQVHGDERKKAFPGERVGVNLAGIDREEIERGDVLATPGSLKPATHIDARLDLLTSAPMIVEHGTRIRFHIGAREVIGRVYMIDSEEIYPGETALVQYRLEENVVARHRESYVIRRYSPMTTIGGGKVIESDSPRRKKFDKKAIRELKIKEKGTPAEIVKLQLELSESPSGSEKLKEKTGFSREKLENIVARLEKKDEIKRFSRYQSPRWIEKSVLKKVEDQTKELVKTYHDKYPLRRGISREELRSQLDFDLNSNELRELVEEMEAENEVKAEDEYISLPEFAVEFTGEAAELKDDILEDFQTKPYTPPDRKDLLQNYSQDYDGGLVKEVIRSLEEDGTLLRITEEIYMLMDSVEEAEKMLVDYLKKNGSIELSEFRDMLASTRKYTLPLLEYFDNEGITERRGDKRYLKGAAEDD